MLRPLLIAALALPIAACNRSDESSAVTISAGNSGGSIDPAAGTVKIDVPGFQGSVKIPKVKIDAGDFDMNGVKLYPGSSIEGVNVAGGSGENGVRLSFTSPASPDTIRTWYADRLNKVGYRVQADGTSLVGTTDENKPFRLDLTADGADKAKGTIHIGG